MYENLLVSRFLENPSNYFYAFTVIEPGTYKFNLKINSEKKKALVQKWRAIIDED